MTQRPLLLPRRAFLGGLLATGVVAGVPAMVPSSTRAASLPTSVDFRRTDWLPTAVNQAGPVCTVAALTQGVSLLMGRAYGWRHNQQYPLSDLFVKSGTMAAYYSGAQTDPVITAYANKSGIVSPLHPHTLIRVGYALPAFTREAWQSMLAAGAPLMFGYRELVWSPGVPATGGVAIAKAPSNSGTGHCVLAVGYDATGLLILNSYGTSWSPSGGYGRIPWTLALEAVDQVHALTSVRPASI